MNLSCHYESKHLITHKFCFIFHPDRFLSELLAIAQQVDVNDFLLAYFFRTYGIRK